MMKEKIFFVICVSILAISLKAQDDVLVLKVEDFDQYDRINLSEREQWRFTEDLKVSWFDGELMATDWIQKGPNNFSKTFGANEYVEGWFMLKFQLDESLSSKPINLNLRNYGQALEIFLDGVLIHTIGKLGENGSGYVRGTPKNLYEFIPIDLMPENVHELTIHYKNKPVKFPASLFTNKESLYFACFLTGPDHQRGNADLDVTKFSLGIISSTIIGTIMVLIMMLLFQNRRDWFLRLLGICILGFLIMSVTNLLTLEGLYTSYARFNILNGMGDLAFALVLPTLPLIYSKIFTDKLPKYAWLSILFFAICILEYRILRYGPLGMLLILISFGICIYYIVRSWKNLKGAQWIIVSGGIIFLVVVIVAFIMLVSEIIIPDAIYPAMILTFPLSLLGYVVFRFREIEHEVKINADKVIQVTEEKRQQALNQQVKLEEEVTARTAELRQSLESLKATQAQLVHSEKMASLGELTAGIAHEIQNPLNFVNNFSEVSSEMIDEVGEELENGDIEETKNILKDLKGNLEKISHHGKRASGIVKSMLDHSRSSGGEKIPTDINALCDEYLRLAYHGMRAKDRSFNASMETNFDESLPKIKILPQDIGRVILNLINNAFQAINEKTLTGLQALSGVVSVSTKNYGDKIEITVSDNGPGIPEEIKDKIFQPFFTTKPTGQGTGLGLSLSYDIIKAHGGEIRMTSSSKTGTIFFIILPIDTIDE